MVYTFEGFFSPPIKQNLHRCQHSLYHMMSHVMFPAAQGIDESSFHFIHTFKVSVLLHCDFWRLFTTI